MSGWGEFRNEIRWTIVVVVLALAGIVALWPREAAQQPGSSGPGAPPPVAQGAAGQDPSAQRPVDPALRARAALKACSAAGGARSPELTGAAGTCLADGSPTDLGALVGDRPTLINVWATWCGPCQAELPALQEYSTRPGSIGVVGVQVQSDAAGGLELLRTLGVHFPNVQDGGNRIRAALPMQNVLPASFVVTSRGEVRRVNPPIAFKSADEVGEAVRRTLGSDQ